MPIYGLKNYGELDRFSTFLRSALGSRMKADVAIKELGRSAKEHAAVAEIFKPLIAMETGVPTITTLTTETPEEKGEIKGGLTDLSGVEGEKSVAARNNNPLNLKWSDWQKQYQGEPGDETPAGRFTRFPSLEFGLLAAEENLRRNYADLDVDAAMKRWSGAGLPGQGKGYGGEIYPEIKNKKIGELNDQELSELIDRMARHEGVIVEGKPVDISPAQEKAKQIKEGGLTFFGKEGTTPIEAKAVSPVSTKTKVPSIAYPTEQEIDRMEIQTFAKLLARGTPESMAAADKLVKMRTVRSQRKPESYLLRQETYTGDVGEKKIIDIFGYRDASGKEVITEKKYTDVTPAQSLEEKERLKEESREKKLIQKYTEDYNKAIGTIEQIETGAGKGDQIAGRRKLATEYQEAMSQENFKQLISSGPGLEELYLASLSPGLQLKYKQLLEYHKALASKGAAEANLRSLGYEYNTETGKAEEYGTSKIPKGTRRGYF